MVSKLNQQLIDKSRKLLNNVLKELKKWLPNIKTILKGIKFYYFRLAE
jgi:predicted nucleotide-binding protein (sugar kinase/HSP70/actin superfamily)